VPGGQSPAVRGLTDEDYAKTDLIPSRINLPVEFFFSGFLKDVAFFRLFTDGRFVIYVICPR
jgi:hypothetical protein